MNELIDRVSSFLQKDLSARGVEFSIQNEVIKPAELADRRGLLGMFLLEGARHYEEMFMDNISLAFFEDEGSLLDLQPWFDGKKHSFSAWSHLLNYVLDQVLKKNAKLKAKNSAIPLDALYAKWVNGQKKIVSNPLSSPAQSH